MDGKGGGGGAGDMLQYGNKALDLQKKIYGELKQKTEPYYQAGTGGLNELMMRMGLQGGPYAGQTSGQIRSQLLPSYTRQAQSAQTQPNVLSRDYGAYDADPQVVENLFNQVNNPENPERAATAKGTLLSLLKNKQITSGGSSIDEAGLNKAVQDAMSAQQAQRDNPLYGSLLKPFGMEDYQADPGYAFRLSEGKKALERASAARGQFAEYNPAAARALMSYGQGLASEEFGNAYNRYNQDQGNIFSRLANISGIGQNATGQLAGIGQNYANAATDLYTGMGNAVTAAKQAKAANSGSMFNTLLGAGLSIGMAPMTGGGSLFGSWLSDERMKENIRHVGVENGHNIYSFNYKGSPNGFIGVMAQEVMKSNPDAVIECDGFYAVNYDKIGVKFREDVNAA